MTINFKRRIRMTTFNTEDYRLSEMILAQVIESIRQNTKSEKLAENNLTALYKRINHLARKNEIPSQLAKSFRTLRKNTSLPKESEMHKSPEIFFPKSVGGAKIQWKNIDLNYLDSKILEYGNGWFPNPTNIFRDVRGEYIILPKNLLREIYFLKNNTQCVARFGIKGPCKYLLFGMSENQFMTGITHASWKQFKDYGEERFFLSLVPKSVLDSSLISKEPIVNQGVLFVCKIGSNWEESVNIIKELKGCDKRTLREVINFRLFRTGHHLDGQTMLMNKILPSSKKISKKNRRKKSKKSNYSLRLIKGTLSHPHFSDLNLSDGVYVVAKTSNLLGIPSWGLFDKAIYKAK